MLLSESNVILSPDPCFVACFCFSSSQVAFGIFSVSRILVFYDDTLCVGFWFCFVDAHLLGTNEPFQPVHLCPLVLEFFLNDLFHNFFPSFFSVFFFLNFHYSNCVFPLLIH